MQLHFADFKDRRAHTAHSIASRCADTAASNARSPRMVTFTAVSPHTNKKCYDEPIGAGVRYPCVARSHPAARRNAMSIIRLIHIRLDPSETENAVGVWKTECAPIMIQQKGCLNLTH
jgi:hypothetical protein